MNAPCQVTSFKFVGPTTQLKVYIHLLALKDNIYIFIYRWCEADGFVYGYVFSRDK